MTKTIGIIGANGQLGSEVCLLLSQMEGFKPVPICRNDVGATFLRRCGLDVRIGATDNEENTRRLLADLDLVADFSLPAGSTSYVRAQISRTTGNLIRFAPDGIPFVYLSSILAFGNPDFHSELKNYRFSRSAYGATKRYAEKLVQSLSSKYRRPSYVFRVGVVHGEMQAATRQALKEISANSHLTAHLPDCDSYTVFAFTIAEALMSAVDQTQQPGLYTLVSNPAWSWSDLHTYLCDRAGVRQSVVLMQPPHASAGSVVRRLKGSIVGALKGHKEILNGYVGAVLPNLEQQMRATYHMRNAKNDIASGIAKSRYMPYFDNFTVYPGERYRGISDSRVKMAQHSQKLREFMRFIAT